LLWRYTQKPIEKEKTRKKAMGIVGGGAGRSDSGDRRMDDYRGAYGTIGQVEKPVSSPGFTFMGAVARPSAVGYDYLPGPGGQSLMPPALTPLLTFKPRVIV
jgi:hypothetical protein